MLNLVLVTYDNLVMCLALYLHYPRHDCIEGIYLFIEYAEHFTIS